MRYSFLRRPLAAQRALRLRGFRAPATAETILPAEQRDIITLESRFLLSKKSERSCANALLMAVTRLACSPRSASGQAYATDGRA
jgi:hypothetical protein